MADDPGEELLARNMVDVHGAEAATIVRANARGAAVAGQPVQAKSWIRVLGMIQGPVANSGVGRTMGCTGPSFTLCEPAGDRNRPTAAGSARIPSRRPRNSNPFRSHSMASNPRIVRRAVWKD